MKKNCTTLLTANINDVFFSIVRLHALTFSFKLVWPVQDPLMAPNTGTILNRLY